MKKRQVSTCAVLLFTATGLAFGAELYSEATVAAALSPGSASVQDLPQVSATGNATQLCKVGHRTKPHRHYPDHKVDWQHIEVIMPA